MALHAEEGLLVRGENRSLSRVERVMATVHGDNGGLMTPKNPIHLHPPLTETRRIFSGDPSIVGSFSSCGVAAEGRPRLGMKRN